MTFIRFPIFNFADMFLVGGTMLLSAVLLFVIKEEIPAQTQDQEGAEQHEQ